MNRAGFTGTEAKVILFLVAALVAGAGGLYVKNHYFGYEASEFDYSQTDSLFLSAGKVKSGEDSVKISDKKVDYEQELLDFSKNELSDQKDESGPVFINVNTADISDLTTLPGVGEITAKRIVEYRNKHHGFRNLDELLAVKGIGQAKLKKLKKFLIIE